LLRRPDVSYAGLMSLDGGRYQNAKLPVATLPAGGVQHASDADVPDAAVTDALDFVASVVEQVEIAAKYSGYIDRQKGEVERAAFYENLRLPLELDYMQVSALSMEARQRLNKYRPDTLGQASRLSGITPATISLLLIHLKKGNFRGFVDKLVVAEGGGAAGDATATHPEQGEAGRAAAETQSAAINASA
jgi:tRNA uridine 5-carboxymethylaminomethyl modification enzyme